MPRKCILLRDNQFGQDGPQMGDVGYVTGKFWIPNMETVWYYVTFDDVEGYSCPSRAIAFLED